MSIPQILSYCKYISSINRGIVCQEGVTTAKSGRITKAMLYIVP